MTPSVASESPVARRIYLGMGAGAFALVALVALVTVWELLAYPHPRWPTPRELFDYTLFAAGPVFGMWAITLLPATWCIPAGSAFWSPFIAPLTGALLGAALPLLVIKENMPPRLAADLVVAGTIIGFLMFLAASVLLRRSVRGGLTAEPGAPPRSPR